MSTRRNQPSGERQLNIVLQSLSDADRLAVMAAGKAAAFSAGETLCELGQEIDRVIFIVEGVVSLSIPMRTGAAVEVMILGREAAVGLMAAHGPVRAFGRVRAETDGKAIFVPAPHLGRLMAEREGLRRVVGEQAIGSFREIAQAAACNAVHKLQPRLAKCLLRFHDRVNGDELALTQDHISRMLGVSRTTLNAVAQALQEKGVVRYARGRLGVIDRKGLESLACECYERPEVYREG